MKKIFWIYFSAPEVLDYPLDKKVFFEAYAEIIETLEKKWIKTVIVRNHNYLWDWYFSNYFIWNGETYEKIDEKIKVDLLWNRDSENLIPKIDDLEMLNRFDFDEICRDKIKTYEMFNEFSAETYLLNSYSDLEKNIDKIKTDKIVLKPRFWEWCQWIFIIDKDEIKEELYCNWSNVLLQEFLDSSCWVEWLVEWLHEINIFMVNWEFSGWRIKKPAEWNLISSATGASIWKVWWIKQTDVPEKLFEELKKLDSKLTNFPLRLYRADFVYTTNWNYKLIELNSRPGVMHQDKEWKEFYWDFNWRIVDLVEDYLR